VTKINHPNDLHKKYILSQCDHQAACKTTLQDFKEKQQEFISRHLPQWYQEI
jgi:hypothetical protein